MTSAITINPCDYLDESGPVGCQNGTDKNPCKKPVVVRIKVGDIRTNLCSGCAARLASQITLALGNWASYGARDEVGRYVPMSEAEEAMIDATLADRPSGA